MILVTRLDANTLKHILAILLSEPLSTTSDISLFCSCFVTTGISNASNFLILDPPTYGAVMCLIVKDGSSDHQLNVIQVKKLGSLLSWFQAQPIQGTSTKFNLDFDGFQAHHIKFVTVTLIAAPTTFAPMAVGNFHKGICYNLLYFKLSKEDFYWYS
eukprot:964023-Ditylum_brightwellii.AAC.1